jgi:DNA modification methylase
VLDPFFGSGTVGEVCLKLKRRYVGIEIKPEYVEMAKKRIKSSIDLRDFYEESGNSGISGNQA